MSDLRMSGLATGLDTTTIIQQLMAVERRPVDMMETRQATAQRKLDAYRAINTKIMALQTAAKNVMGTSSTLSPFSNNSATSSNTNAFTASAANTASPGTYNVTINNLASAQTYGGSAFNAAQAGGSFDINGPNGIASITVNAGDSAQDIANQVNSNVNSSMNATVVGGRLLLSAKTSGAAGNATITQTGGGASFMDDISLSAATNVAGVDASATVNGINITSSNNVFTNAMSGVDLTAVAAGSGTVTIAKDNTAAVNGIKDLVAKFNDIVNTIRDYTKYDATTKKGGVLAGDAFAQDLITRMTSQITESFDTSAYNASPANPGLRNYTDVGLSIQRDGTLTLDETKLKSAMTTYASPTAGSASIYQLFANEDGAMNGTTKLNNAGSSGVYGDGLANRLWAFGDMMISPTSLYNSPNGGGRYEGALLAKINSTDITIKDYDKQIDAYNARLEQRQRFLQSQFTAMETAVAKLRSQGDYFNSQAAKLSG